MEKLDQFTQGYLNSALFAEIDDSGEPLDKNYSISDFAPEALAKAIFDCKRFQEENLDDILETPEWNGSDSYTSTGYPGLEVAGQDFWLNRNGHGCGFWSRDYYTDEVKNRLDKACSKFGECYIYVGDDNKLYFV